MAPQNNQPPPKPANRPTKSRIHKLPRLPKSTLLTKRPLLHPPIPPPHASTQKTIYIAPHTPFISAVKRVRSLLTPRPPLPTKSHPTNPHPSTSPQSHSNTTNPPKPPATAPTNQKSSAGEEVILRGTGRAVEKVLSLGLFFQGQTDCRVRIGTGSVGAVDDVEWDGDGDGAGDGEAEGEEGEGGTRVRRVSAVEVGVGLR